MSNIMLGQEDYNAILTVNTGALGNIVLKC